MKITYSWLLLSVVLWHQHSATASLHLGSQASLVRRSMQETTKTSSGDPSCTTSGCPGMNIEIPDATMEAQFDDDGAGPAAPQSFSPDALLDNIQAETEGDPASLTEQPGANDQSQSAELDEEEDCEEEIIQPSAALNKEDCEEEVIQSPAALKEEDFKEEPTQPPAAFEQGTEPPANLAPAPPAATVTETVTETITMTVTDCAPSSFAPEPTPMADEQSLVPETIPLAKALDEGVPQEDPECAGDPAANSSLDNEEECVWVCEGDEGFDPALVPDDPDCNPSDPASLAQSEPPVIPEVMPEPPQTSQPDPASLAQSEPPVIPEVMPEPPQTPRPDPASLNQSEPLAPAAIDSEPCNCNEDSTPAVDQQFTPPEPTPAAVQQEVTPADMQQPVEDCEEDLVPAELAPTEPEPTPAAVQQEITPADMQQPVEDCEEDLVSAELAPTEPEPTPAAVQQEVVPAAPIDLAPGTESGEDIGEKCEDESQPAADLAPTEPEPTPAAVQEEVVPDAPVEPVEPAPAEQQVSTTVEPAALATEAPAPDVLNQDLDGDGTITVTSTTCTDTSSSVEAALATVTTFECNECEEAAMQESPSPAEPETAPSVEENQANLDDPSSSSEAAAQPTESESGERFSFFDKVKNIFRGSSKDTAETPDSPTYLNRRAWSHRKHYQA